jgi:putative glutathione S-transferase
MGSLSEGQWQDQEVRRTNDKGDFIRNESPYRDFIAGDPKKNNEKGNEQFPVEKDRYHLFVNAGCPWAYRTMLYRSIKNLEPYITMSYSQPAMGTEGWTFGDAGEPLLSAKHLHEVYTAADDMFTYSGTKKQALSLITNLLTSFGCLTLSSMIWKASRRLAITTLNMHQKLTNSTV